MQNKMHPHCFFPRRFLFLIGASIFFLLAESPTVNAQRIGTALPKQQPIQEMIDAQLFTAQTTLNSQNSIAMYLQITNKSNLQIQVTDVDTSKTISFIQVCPEQCPEPGNFKPMSVSPRQALILRYTVKTNGPIQTGKQLLVFDIGFAWREAGTDNTSNIILTKEIDVEVLGVNPILALLGIPSLLVLPGFLMLVTFRLLLTLGPKSSSANNPLLQATDSRFWMIAITLSILFSLVYRFFAPSIDYPAQYSLSDVISVWFLSILLVAVPTIIIKGCYSLLRPNLGNSQITTLYKLGFRGLSICRPRCQIKEENNNQTREKICFLLERNLKPKQDEVWACSGIVVQRISEDNPSANKEAIFSLNKAYERMVADLAKLQNRPSSPQSVLWTIRFAHLLARGKDITWKLDWGWSERGTGLLLVKGTAIGCSNQTEKIFWEE